MSLRSSEYTLLDLRRRAIKIISPEFSEDVGIHDVLRFLCFFMISFVFVDSRCFLVTRSCDLDDQHFQIPAFSSRQVLDGKEFVNAYRTESEENRTVRISQATHEICRFRLPTASSASPDPGRYMMITTARMA